MEHLYEGTGVTRKEGTGDTRKEGTGVTRKEGTGVARNQGRGPQLPGKLPHLPRHNMLQGYLADKKTPTPLGPP